MLLETIKCNDGKLFNLEFHQARFDLARQKFFPKANKIKLANFIQIPDDCRNGLFRCRISYSENIEKIEFIPHRYKKVERLRLVECNDIDYNYKYAERTKLQQLFNQRGICDDILIVKNGCISDSFTANVIFFDGKEWWTPNTPLLPGTQRARLIAEGKISVCEIPLPDLHKYKKVGLINALWDIENMPKVSTAQIEKQG